VISALQRALTALARTPARSSAPAKAGTRTVRSGEVGSGWDVSGGIPDIDYLDDLGWPKYLEEFRKVANDPDVAAELREAKMPLLRADTSVEPASDDRRDVLMAEFISANLYQQETENFGAEFWCQTPWPNRLRDALRFLENGFALFQRLYRKQGRYIVIDKLKYLMPESIERWDFGPNDRFLGVWRNYVGSDGTSQAQEYVSAEELFIYTWDQEGSNILGKPLIRAMWKPYQFKTRMEKLAAIDKMKTAVGIPFFLNNKDDSPQDLLRGEQIAKMMRSGNFERLYAAIKEGQDFGWKEGGKETKGLPEWVDFFALQISKAGGAGLARQLGLGQEGGSRGVAGAQTLMGIALPMAIAMCIVQYENELIRTTIDLNFATERRAYPKAKFMGIDPFEKTRNLPEVVIAIEKGAITSTLDTENDLRRGYGMQEIEEAERNAVIEQKREDARAARDAAGGAGMDDEEEDGEGGGDRRTAPPGTDAGDAAASGDGDEAGLARSLRARPLELQDNFEPDPDPIVRARVDAAAIRGELERWEAVYLASLSLVQRDMQRAVVDQVRAGNLKPRTPADVKVPFQEDLKERLVSILKSVRDYGRDQVVAEVNRQLHALRRAAATPDPSTRRGAIKYSNNQAEVTAELDVSNLVQRLQAEVTSRFNDLVGTGQSTGEIAEALDDYLASLSPRQIENMARTSTATVFNAGRNVSILELKSQLQPMAMRVEVLDDNTCEPCAELDGKTFRIGSAEYLENQPPRECKGGERCRGFYVVEAKP
jgi:hypothetical protein